MLSIERSADWLDTNSISDYNRVGTVQVQCSRYFLRLYKLLKIVALLAMRVHSHSDLRGIKVEMVLLTLDLYDAEDIVYLSFLWY